MPLYTIESGGNRYQVESDTDLNDEDIMAVIGDEPAPPPDKPFFDLSDTLTGIGSALMSAPTSGKAAFYRLSEGFERPDRYSENARAAFAAEDERRKTVQADIAARQLAGDSSSVGETFREVGPDLGSSLGSMAASIPAMIAGGAAGAKLGAPFGAPAGPVGVSTGGVIGGALGAGAAGLAAGGTAAYRMAGAQFLRDAFNAGLERYQNEMGEEMPEDQRDRLYRELLPLAETSALWEAGPEAVGNLAMAGAGKMILGFGKPFITELAKTAMGKVGVKAAAGVAGVGTELATETATALGQGQPQAAADLLAAGRPAIQAISPYDKPGGTLQALKDVAPGTLAQVFLMSGAGAVAKGTQSLLKPGAPASPEVDENGVPIPLAESIREQAAKKTVTPQQKQTVAAATNALAVADTIAPTVPQTAEALAQSTVTTLEETVELPSETEAPVVEETILAAELPQPTQPEPVVPDILPDISAVEPTPDAPQITPEQPVPAPQAEVAVAEEIQPVEPTQDANILPVEPTPEPATSSSGTPSAPLPEVISEEVEASPALAFGDTITYREQGQELTGTINGADNLGRVRVIAADGKEVRIRPQSILPKQSTPTREDQVTSGGTEQAAEPQGSSRGSSEITIPDGKEVSTIAMEALRAENDALPAAAKKAWTPEVYAKAQAYFESGDMKALSGLTAIQKRRAEKARQDADADYRAQIEESERAQRLRDATEGRKKFPKLPDVDEGNEVYIAPDAVAEVSPTPVADVLSSIRAIYDDEEAMVRETQQQISQRVDAALAGAKVAELKKAAATFVGGGMAKLDRAGVISQIKSKILTKHGHKTVDRGSSPSLAQTGQGSINLRGGKGISKRVAQQVVDEFRAAAPRAPAVRLVTREQIRTSTSPIYESIRKTLEKYGTDETHVEGWYSEGTGVVYLVPENLTSMDRAREVLIHESLSHYGIDAYTTPEERAPIVDAIRRDALEIVERVESLYEGSDADTIGREILAAFSEEYTAADPANTPAAWKRIWEQIKMLVRGIIKRLGGDPNAFDDLDIYNFMTAASRRLVKGPTRAEMRKRQEVDDARVSPSLRSAERAMSTQVRSMASNEEIMDRGWEATNATAMDRTIDGEPVEPVAYKIKANPTVDNAAHNWLNDFTDEYADLPAEERGKLLLKFLHERKSPSGDTLSQVAFSAIATALSYDMRRLEFGISAKAAEIARRRPLSEAGFVMQYAQIYDPMEKLLTETEGETENQMKGAGMTQEDIDALKEEQQKAIDGIIVDMLTESLGAQLDAASTNPTPEAKGELDNFKAWVFGTTPPDVMSFKEFTKRYVQLARFDSDAFVAGIKKLFPTLEDNVIETMADAFIAADKKTVQTKNDINARAQKILQDLAIEMSDTPPAERAKKRDKLRELVQDGLSGDEPLLRFVERAMDLKIKRSVAESLFAVVEMGRQRRVMIENARLEGRLAEARARAIEKLIDRLSGLKQNKDKKESLGRFLASLNYASQFGVLDKEMFSTAFAHSFQLHGLTPQIVTRLRGIWQDLQAVDPQGRQKIFGIARQQLENEFLDLVNAVSPGARWDNFIFNAYQAGVLSSASTMLNQMSGLFKTLGGVDAFSRTWARGDPQNVFREWFRSVADVIGNMPLAIAGIKGDALGLYPSGVRGGFVPTEQALQRTGKGQQMRIRFGDKTVVLPEGLRKILRAKELFTWRLIHGAEALSGVTDTQARWRDQLTEFYKRQGLSAGAANDKALKDLASNPEDKEQALAVATQEQKDGKIGKGPGILKRRQQELIARNIEIRLNSNLQPQVEQLAAASQFKTVPTGVIGSMVYSFFNYIGGAATEGNRIARAAKFYLLFGRFLGHTFDTMLAYSPLGLFTSVPSPESKRGRVIREIYGDTNLYKRQQQGKAAASVAFLASNAVLLAAAQALAGDDEEPVFQIFGSGPIGAGTRDAKEKLKAAGVWEEGTVKIFGKSINYLQIPELSALLLTLGNLSDYVRFGDTLYPDGEGGTKDPVDAAVSGLADALTSPVKRSTYRQWFTAFTAAMEGRQSDAAWNILTAPAGGMAKVPIVTDLDKAFRQAEGSQDAKGFTENLVRRIPFVTTGEMMYNAYGEKLPGLGVIGMFPPENKSSPEVVRAAKTNIYTGTQRSVPDVPQMKDGSEVPESVRRQFIERAGKLYTDQMNDLAPTLRRIYDTSGREAAKKQVAKISAAANARARAELGLQ